MQIIYEQKLKDYMDKKGFCAIVIESYAGPVLNRPSWKSQQGLLTRGSPEPERTQKSRPHHPGGGRTPDSLPGPHL